MYTTYSIVIISISLVITVLLTYAVSMRIRLNVLFFGLLAMAIFIASRAILLPFVTIFQTLFSNVFSNLQTTNAKENASTDFDYSICPAIFENDDAIVDDTLVGRNMSDFSSGIDSTCSNEENSVIFNDPSGIIDNHSAFPHYCSPTNKLNVLKTNGIQSSVNDVLPIQTKDECRSQKLNKRLSYYFE